MQTTGRGHVHAVSFRGLALLVLLALGLFAAGCPDQESVDTTEFPATVTSGDTAADNTDAGGAPTTDATDSGTADGNGDAGPSGSPADDVARQLSPSVVRIIATSPAPGGAGGNGAEGSGVIYSSDGLIVTNNHVVAAGGDTVADNIQVTLAGGPTYQAVLVGRDPRSDLALLRIDAKDLPAAIFLDDLSSVEPGDYAIAIGNPLGFEGSITLGVVSGIERELAPLFTDLIQTDASISPGNSGGALADEQGRVIGINAAAVPPTEQTRAQNLGFAIPADLVVTVIEQLRETGKVRYAFLGVQSVTVGPALRQQLGLSTASGVLVVRVGDDTPAAQAGLQQGDIITQLNGEDIEHKTDLFNLMRENAPGDIITLTVVRSGEMRTLEVTLEEAPAMQ